MSKMNYSKIELAIEQVLQKIQIDLLSELADIAAGIGSRKKSKEKISKERKKLILALQLDIMRLLDKDTGIYAKLKIKKSTLDYIFAHPEEIKDDGWAKVEELCALTGKYILEYYPEVSDEEHIEIQQRRHINKRFNVSERWLPLQ